MALQRSYTAGKFAMQLDGADVGFVVSVEGGEPFGEVVEAPPVGVRVDKHIGGVRYAPIVVEVGTSMAAAFREWVDAMLQGRPTAKNGAISFLDYNMKERTRLEWTAGLITEVGFPALDASSKDAAVMRVTIQPERSTFRAGSGATYQQGAKAKSQGDALATVPVGRVRAGAGAAQGGQGRPHRGPPPNRRRGSDEPAARRTCSTWPTSRSGCRRPR